ncbi:inactive serine protease 35-like [Oncorhynchus keta]|uniref:inactive serine protease 35-like n=1 Tax=Oncorhynchus keta TaxID=8018 RepID=UPI00227A6A28|nr:inactive serine protease 35-like [Oncorhynchus keta]
MTPIPLCLLLLCALPLCVLAWGGHGDGVDEEYGWSMQRVPLILDRHTVHLRSPTFGGKVEGAGEDEEGGCGIKCQSARPPPDWATLESMLGYETVYENGTRTHSNVTLQGLNDTTSHTPLHTPSHTRRKRQVYGEDGRFVISDSHFTTSYPFSTAVRLSTGCSGVQVSEKHILTAAHCVHDGKDYLQGVRRLKVGVLQVKSKRGRRGGRRRGGRRGGEEGQREEVVGVEEKGNGIDGEEPRQEERQRGGRRGGGEGQGEEVVGGEEKGNGIDGEEPRQEERQRGGRRGGGEGQGEEVVGGEEKGNGIDGEEPRQEQRRRGGRRRKGEREKQNRVDETGAEGREGGNMEKERGQGGGRQRKKGSRSSRVQRSTELKIQPSFHWTRVKQTHIPKGWIHTGDRTNAISHNYDYALLELKQPIKQKHMKLGVVAPTKPLPLGRIHFSGFDNESEGEQKDEGGEKVVYRFCSVTEESDDLLYQHCDAQQGASGAGVYIRLRQEVVGSNKGKWQRKVIGVFSGHRRVDGDGGEQRDYNVAVRITPPKYAQICHWIHGDPSMCREA